MNKVIKNRIINAIIIFCLISIAIECILLVYNIAMKKIFNKLHLIGNVPIEIMLDKVEIEKENDQYYINVKNLENVNIYNISMYSREKNNDVYMRIISDNGGKFMPKENKDATKFKVYFLRGMQTSSFSIVFAEGTINLNNIEKIEINGNIDYMPKIEFSILRIACIFCILLLGYLFLRLYKYLRNKEESFKFENIFLVLSLIFGIIFVFINLPQVRYDEHSHFWRAYEISNGYFVSKGTHEYPASIKELFENEDGSYPNRNMTYSKTIYKNLQVDLEKSRTTRFSAGATGSLTPISYIPQTVGVIIGKILNLKPIIILWIARLCNLIAYSTIIFFAIKIIPRTKWKILYMIIGLLPMSINLAASLSPDTIIISCTMLAIAYTMRLKYEKNSIRFKDTCILGILYMIPTVCKVVYIPLLLLFLTLPTEKFKNKKNKYFYFICSSLIVVLPYLILNKIVRTGNYDIAIRSNTVENFWFTISDPIRTLYTLISSIYTESSMWLFEMIGGWNTINIISIAFLILLLIENFKEDDEDIKYSLLLKDKIIITIIWIIEVIGIIAALYIAWTQAKEKLIDGIQGRYFLPILPLLLIQTSKSKIKVNANNQKTKYIFAVGIMYICIFIYTIIISY